MPDNPNKKLNYLILFAVLFILPLVGNIQDIRAVKIHPEHLVVMGLFLALVYLIISVKKPTRHRLGKISILLIISSLHLSSKDYTKGIAYFLPSDTPEKHDWINHYFNHSGYTLLKPFLQQIALDTGWQTGTAIKRMYIIGGIDRESSLWAFYSLAKEQLKKRKFLNESNSQIQGYFIIAHLEQFKDYIQKDWKEYLSHSPHVSSFVQKEIKADKLLLQPSKFYEHFWLIPYKLTEDSVFPDGFYNFGQSYYWEEPHWLKTCRSSRHFSDNNHNFYYCMILPGHLQRAGVHITFSRETEALFIEASFFGPMLGLKAENTLTDGHAYWSDIKVALFCNNQKFVYPLSNIGYNPKWYPDLTALSKSLNSPLKLKIPIHCKKEELSGINLKFKHWKRKFWDFSEIDSVTYEQKNITWHLSGR